MAHARELLGSYLQRIGEDDAVDAVARAAGAETAVRAVADILDEACRGSGPLDEMSSALFWVRDASIGVGSQETRAAVRECVPHRLRSTLANALVAPRFAIRSAAIYTFGKMTFKEDLRLLRGVLDRYLDRDPILLPKLIAEMCWLGLGEETEPVLARVRGHGSYLTRWSFFGTDHSDSHDECTELANDPSELVRAEARWTLDLFATGDDPEHGVLHFVDAAARFTNAVTDDYEWENLDEFVRSLRAG